MTGLPVRFYPDTRKKRRKGLNDFRVAGLLAAPCQKPVSSLPLRAAVALRLLPAAARHAMKVKQSPPNIAPLLTMKGTFPCAS